MLSNPNLWYKTSSSGGRIEDSPIIGEWTGISYTGFDTAEVMYAQADVGGLIHGTVAAANTYPTRVVVALRSSPPGESQHGFDEVLFWEENEIVDLNVEVPPSPGQWVVIGVGYPWGEAPDSMDGSYGRLISVVPTDPPPTLVANDDEATTNAGTPVTVDVLANDTLGDNPVALADLDGPPTIHEQPANGTVSVGADGKITYTPNPGFTGTDEFVYRIAIEDQPDLINLCVHFGEGWDVFNQFDGIFDKNLPIRVDSNNGECATLDYNPESWAQYWQVNYGYSECPEPFYPNVGERVIVSQGSVSIEAEVYESIGIRLNGGVWEINNPWWGLDPYTELLLTHEGESYRGMVDDNGTTIHWDSSPPSPQGGVPYTAEVMYSTEAGEVIQCALVTIIMD